jgi:hypothetical protein
MFATSKMATLYGNAKTKVILNIANHLQGQGKKTDSKTEHTR